MLGCQDFCGYYDWTFDHIRQAFGQQAVRDLWAQAIGGDSQQHYVEAARGTGLKGLYQTWTQTGEDEKCDWTFTLDEAKNVLRWDMRQCPSKGFLLQNDLNRDEDYCDHCMGWEGPMLESLGIEIAGHEHNHSGQCWGELRVKGKAYESLDLAIDIRKDPRWKHGYVDRFAHHVKLALLESASRSADSCDVLRDWFAGADQLLVLGRGPSAMEEWARALPREHVIVTAPTYVTRDVFDGEPMAVLISSPPDDALAAGVAARFNQTPADQRPLLMYAYLPSVAPFDFARFDLPRPVPILPLLIRQTLYRHEPNAPFPTTGVFALLLAVALGKPVATAGIDLYRHPSGRAYADDSEPPCQAWPSYHSLDCDLRQIQRAQEIAGKNLRFPPGG